MWLYLLFLLFLLIVVTYDAVHVTTGWTTDNHMLFTEVSVIREINLRERELTRKQIPLRQHHPRMGNCLALL